MGARGLWGKSTLYQESAAIPLLIAGPGIEPGVCETPVDLLDLYPTLLECAGIDPGSHLQNRPGRALLDIANHPYDDQRVIFSEYHAAGSDTAAYMVRKGRWKYHYYVRFTPELFDLQDDPQETNDLSADFLYSSVLQEMHEALLEICDPEETDARAKVDQKELIERFGGREGAFKFGAAGATPAPAT